VKPRETKETNAKTPKRPNGKRQKAKDPPYFTASSEKYLAKAY